MSVEGPEFEWKTGGWDVFSTTKLLPTAPPLLSLLGDSKIPFAGQKVLLLDDDKKNVLMCVWNI
jgi:hypothetical protein